MKDTVRDSDFVARYGGEEIAVIAPETDLRQAAFLAERVRKAIEAASCDHDGKRLAVTASFGISAVTDPSITVEPQALIECADRALYEAKRSGRNRCCFTKFVPVPQPTVVSAGRS